MEPSELAALADDLRKIARGISPSTAFLLAPLIDKHLAGVVSELSRRGWKLTRAVRNVSADV